MATNKTIIYEDWLLEQDIPAGGGQPDMAGGQAPMSGVAGDPGMTADPNVSNLAQNQQAPGGMPEAPTGEEDDVSGDPEAPDMPEEQERDDFEVWKDKYLKESIKGDPNVLIDMINEVREDELEAYQRKFVEDNLDIQLLRMNSNIAEASDEVRKMIKDQLDQNNPATSVVSYITDVLSSQPLLNNIFIKLNGYGALKSDLHRKFIAALTGSVQVGSGANTEDIIFNDREYSIMMSTRFNARWGDVNIGHWALKEDDPERYLSEPELKRLSEGSPEEKDALRHRIVVESIADQFNTRAFIINVVDEKGSIYTLGWDIANAVKGAYSDGKLVVRTRHSDNSEAMIDDNGEIIPLIDLNINYVYETGGQDEEGQPAVEETEFLQRRNGMLFLVATMDTIKEASTTMQSTVFKEVPYAGNPSDLKVLERCVYSAHDLLLRQC